MEEDAVPVILLVVGFEENAVDPTDVSALVLQADANGAALPAEQSISQEELDEMISSGRMPAVCMGSPELGQQWSQFGGRPGISMSFVLVQANVSAAAGDERTAATRSTPASVVGGSSESENTALNAGYFEAYEQMNVHELMLKDRPRTETYRDAISAAIARIADERRAAAELGLPAQSEEPIRVLDVGAGTGILCMCAAAAAKQQRVPIQIVAIEGSRMADVATSLIAQNGFADVVTVVHGAVEDLHELPGCRGGDVDIIVSEWMGFYLLHESMLNSVLVARDRWLRPGGLMLPSRATIFAAPLSLGRSLSWWRNVYGFDFSPVISRVLEEAANHNPQCDRVVDNADVMAQREVVAEIDCTTVTVASLAVLRKRLQWNLDASAPVHGLVFWFDCTFPGPSNSPESEIVLRTGPDAPKTHWHQTVVHFGSAVASCGHNGPGGRALEQLETGAGAPGQRRATFSCSVELKVDPNAPRSYAITVELG